MRLPMPFLLAAGKRNRVTSRPRDLHLFRYRQFLPLPCVFYRRRAKTLRNNRLGFRLHLRRGSTTKSTVSQGSYRWAWARITYLPCQFVQRQISRCSRTSSTAWSTIRTHAGRFRQTSQTQPHGDRMLLSGCELRAYESRVTVSSRAAPAGPDRPWRYVFLGLPISRTGRRLHCVVRPHPVIARSTTFSDG
jgi:hypothetical protein